MGRKPRKLPGTPHASAGQGFHPWLFTAAPPGLKEDCQKQPRNGVQLMTAEQAAGDCEKPAHSGHSPFTWPTAERLAVPHRDFVSRSPSGRTIIIYVYRSDEAFSVVDLVFGDGRGGSGAGGFRSRLLTACIATTSGHPSPSLTIGMMPASSLPPLYWIYPLCTLRRSPSLVEFPTAMKP